MAATSVSVRHIEFVPINAGLNASFYAFQLRAIVQLIFKVQVFDQLIFKLTSYQLGCEAPQIHLLNLASSLRSPQAAKAPNGSLRSPIALAEFDSLRD